MKRYQRGVGAALRGAKALARQRGCSLKEAASSALEEAANHLRDVHDGPGFITGAQVKCRLHGQPYRAKVFNDCGDFNEQMQKYLTTKVVQRLDEILVPGIGAVLQNASERVGTVALLYRDKGVDMKSVQYVAATNLAIIHVNNVVFFSMAMRGVDERRIDEFGTMEARLHDMLGPKPHAVPD